MDIIKTLFPGWALKRALARQQLENMRYYDAAKSSNYRKKPRSAASPQLVTQNGGVTLRDYARDLDENHDIAIGVLDTLVNNIVGATMPITPTMKTAGGELLTSVNDQVRRILKDVQRRPEASRSFHFDEMLRLVCRTWLRDGEILAQRIRGLTPVLKHHSIIPYTVELIEADYLPYDYNATRPQIIQGVEVNNWSEPMAYHLLKSNPNDFFKLRTRPDDVKRVIAEKIFHLKFTRRVGQIRGVTILHGVITRLDDLKDYEESERIAARVNAAFTGYIKKSPETSRVVEIDKDAPRALEMSPGMIFDDLLPGEEVGAIGTERPNSELSNFRNAMLRAVSSGTSSSYSSISKDYDGSYSAQRQGMVESLPSYEKLRNYFIEMFVRPWYQDVIDMALLSESLNLPAELDRDTLYSSDISGVQMPWIDPKKEIEADILAIKSGLKSRAQVVRQRGGDIIEIDKEIEADKHKQPEPAPANTKNEVEENVETV